MSRHFSARTATSRPDGGSRTPIRAARRVLAKLSGSLPVSSRPAAVGEVVLPQPTVKVDRVDAETMRGLRGLPATADQSPGAGAKLGRLWAGHAVRLP